MTGAAFSSEGLFSLFPCTMMLRSKGYTGFLASLRLPKSGPFHYIINNCLGTEGIITTAGTPLEKKNETILMDQTGVVARKKPLISSGEYCLFLDHHCTASAKSQTMWLSM